MANRTYGRLLHANINLSATGEVVAGTTGKKIRVYAINLNVDAALTVNWRDGDSTAIHSPQDFAAKGGYTMAVSPSAGDYLWECTVDNDLDLVISGTGNVAGWVSYYLAEETEG